MKKVLIICDSRGACLNEVINSYLQEANRTKLCTWQVQVKVKRGGNFEHLCQEGITAKGWDYLVLAGGICSFTTKIRGADKISHLCYVTDEEVRNRVVLQFQQEIDAIRHKLGNKLNIATIPPASLHKYNALNNADLCGNHQYGERIQQEQAALIEDLERINEYIKSSNEQVGVETINWRDYVFRNSLKRARTGDRAIRRTATKFNPNELVDGVHFNTKLQEKTYRRLAAVLNREYDRLFQIEEDKPILAKLPELSGKIKETEIGEGSKAKENLLIEIENVLDTSQESVELVLNTSLESNTTSTDEEWDYKRQKKRKLQSVVYETNRRGAQNK